MVSCRAPSKPGGMPRILEPPRQRVGGGTRKGLTTLRTEASANTLKVVDDAADATFVAEVRRLYPRGDKWTVHYVDHEYSRVRHVLTPEICPVGDSGVLEFGCNIGATAIVLAHLGARVTAVDISAGVLRLASLNARRFGVSHSIDFVRVSPARFRPAGARSSSAARWAAVGLRHQQSALAARGPLGPVVRQLHARSV